MFQCVSNFSLFFSKFWKYFFKEEYPGGSQRKAGKYSLAAEKIDLLSKFAVWELFPVFSCQTRR
jgi:hypothetical protein